MHTPNKTEDEHVTPRTVRMKDKVKYTKTR